MTVSHAARSSSTPRSAAVRRRVPSNRNGVVTMPTVSAPSSRAIARDDRCSAGAGAAALAGRDEDHVRAAEHRPELVDSLLGGRRPDLGVGARAEAVREPSPMWIFTGASEMASACTSVLTATKSTCAMPGVHHAVEGVEPGSADADDADRRDVGGAFRRRHPVQRGAGSSIVCEVAGRRRARLRLLGLHGRLGSAAPGSARRRPRRGRRPARREVVDVLDGLLERPRAARAATGSTRRKLVLGGDRRGASWPARVLAAPPRSRGRARPAGPHACSRACAPSSTSFARSR